MICSRNVLEAIDKQLMTRGDAERVVLGSAICFDECWQKARPIISEAVFSDNRNKFVWCLLRDMKSDNIEVDVVSMWKYALKKYPQIQEQSKLAAYICEVTLVIALTGYDKVLSELLGCYAQELRNGRK